MHDCLDRGKLLGNRLNVGVIVLIVPETCTAIESVRPALVQVPMFAPVVGSAS